MSRVCAIIPCHNEELSIAATVNDILRIDKRIMVIVVDNLSSDQTAFEAKKAGAIVLSEPKIGKAYAFRRGLTALPRDTEVIIMIDGDHTYSVDKIKDGIDKIDAGYGLITGNRINQEDTYRIKHYRHGHKLGNKIFSITFRKLFGVNIIDTFSGWRIMNRGFALTLPALAKGFELETEINVHARSLDIGIADISVSYKGRLSGSTSKLSTYKDGAKIFRTLIQLLFSEKPIFAFGMLSLPCFAVSCILFFRSLIPYLDEKVVRFFPSLIIAIGLLGMAVVLTVTSVLFNQIRGNRIVNLKFRYHQIQRSII